MEAKEFEKRIWEIREEVHEKIPPLREEAYTLLWYERKKTEVGKKDGPILKEKEFPPTRQPNEKIEVWASRIENWACQLQMHTRELSDKELGAFSLLLITTRAGWILGALEKLMFSFEDEKKKNSDISNIILSHAMVIVTTSRDHITAAEGHLKNLKVMQASKEREGLVIFQLFPIVILYLMFQILWYFLSPAIWTQVIGDIIFWSLIGAVSLSIIAVAEDSMKGKFDPRHIDKYSYRTPLAPVVALIAVMLLSVIGFTLTSIGTGGGGRFIIDITEPNRPLLIVMSFLLGFFGKRSLELMDFGWRRVFPSTREGS